MSSPAPRAVLARFSEFFFANVDAVFGVVEHFARDFNSAELLVSRILGNVWSVFGAVPPEHRDLLLYDLTHRFINQSGPPPPPVLPIPYAPLDGEWSPLRPSDTHAARVILWSAEGAAPSIDWPLLFLLVRTPLDVVGWSRVTERKVDALTRDIALHQSYATQAIRAVIFEEHGPDCPARPTLASGAIPPDIAGHVSVCGVCNVFASMLIPPPRLVQSSASTKLSAADRNRILASALQHNPPPDLSRRRWWYTQ